MLHNVTNYTDALLFRRLNCTTITQIMSAGVHITANKFDSQSVQAYGGTIRRRTKGQRQHSKDPSPPTLGPWVKSNPPAVDSSSKGA